MTQKQRLRDSLYKFRETLKSLKARAPINQFEFPEKFEFSSNGYINYRERIKEVDYCKRLCLQRLMIIKLKGGNKDENN